MIAVMPAKAGIQPLKRLFTISSTLNVGRSMFKVSFLSDV